VSRQERIPTWQHLPLALRAGMEVMGTTEDDNGENHR
jgi:hypothetical protein